MRGRGGRNSLDPPHPDHRRPFARLRRNPRILAFRDTHLPQMLRLGRFARGKWHPAMMMMDSLDITDTERALIVRSCVECGESRIVVTHGTDTMGETARPSPRRSERAGLVGKTVVLTGAMIPYAFGSSDGRSIWAARGVCPGTPPASTSP